jgi:phospholipase C
MTDHRDEASRRAFLAGALGLTATAELWPGALARAMETPAAHRTGTIRDVEHVVIFMQENRSFDHYFGTLSGVRGFADRRPWTLPSGDPVWRQPDGKGGVVAPFRFDAEGTNFPVMKSLHHDWATGHAAWNEGRYDNWVPAKGPLTMGYLARQDIPYHFALADAFTVCDSYFCSLQGPTCPNRLYLMTGCVDHHGLGGGPVIANIDITQKPDGVVFGPKWRTYAERLQDAGVSWRLYRQGADLASDDDSDGGMNTLMAFERFHTARPGDPLYHAGAEPRRLEQLKADVQNDRLPQVSWITPPRIFCEHPNWPPAYGVEYLARILDALTSNPEVWSKTVFLVMYDENDGFFDHVVPPTPPLSRAEGLSTAPVDDERHPATGQPYGLGMRVPMLVISPWSRGGWVCSQVFDHTSVIRFLETRFGVREPNISAWRRTVCGDLTSAFDFKTPNGEPPRRLATISADRALPDQAAFNAYKAVVAKRPKPVAPAQPPLPRVEPGQRPWRPVPYDLAVDPRRVATGIELTFRNDGAAGASFAVADRGAPETAPRRYTVGAGRSLADLWTTGEGRYALVVEGPAGFLRAFEGEVSVDLETRLRATKDGGLRLSLKNRGPRPLEVSLEDRHADAPRRLRLAPGGARTLRFDTTASARWYDLEVRAEGLRHRFAGHVETGRPSLSEPA